MRLRSIALLLTQGAAASDGLARVDGVLAWLAGNATAPAHWPIRSRDDVKSKNWKHLGGGNVKDVYEQKSTGKGRGQDAPRKRGASRQGRGRAAAGTALPRVPAGFPGVPRLHGGWLQSDRLWYVVHSGRNRPGVNEETAGSA